MHASRFPFLKYTTVLNAVFCEESFEKNHALHIHLTYKDVDRFRNTLDYEPTTDVRYQICTLVDKGCMPRLTYYNVAGVWTTLFLEGHTRQLPIPLALLTTRKEFHGFLLLCMHTCGCIRIVIWLRLTTLWAAGAPLKYM